MVKRFVFSDGTTECPTCGDEVECTECGLVECKSGDWITFDEYEKLAKQLSELRDKLRWIPVKERLPETDKYYEVKINDDVYIAMHLENGYFINGDLPENCRADFWREIPELEDGE
jgi:hypothetical protein